MEEKKVEIKEIHSKLLELMIKFDKFCKENDITYYLMGGSALGAIRHKGFIPWDDDIDVFMTQENYKKIKEICKEKLQNTEFYFQEGNTEEFPYYFSKFRMNNTTYIEEDFKDKTNMHQGFFIDIMCLYNASNNKIFRYIQYLAASILKTKALAEIGYRRNIWWKMILINVSKIIVCKYFKKNLFSIVNLYEGKSTELIGHLFGRAKFGKAFFKSEFLGTPRYVEFENTNLPVPENVESYLESRYGNKYMEIPDQKTRDMYPTHSYIIDPYNDYTNYYFKK